MRALCEHPALDATWSRYDAGERGPDPHVHHEHVDAFYVVEGELEFLVGSELMRAPAGDVRRGAAERRPHVPQQERRHRTVAQLPRAEHGLHGLPTRRAGRLRQLRPARVRWRTPGRRDNRAAGADGELGRRAATRGHGADDRSDFDVAPHRHDDQVERVLRRSKARSSSRSATTTSAPGLDAGCPRRPVRVHGLRNPGSADRRACCSSEHRLQATSGSPLSPR